MRLIYFTLNFLLSSISILSFHSSFGRDSLYLTIKKSAAYFEIFGKAGLYSINYERNILIINKSSLTFSTGMNFWLYTTVISISGSERVDRVMPSFIFSPGFLIPFGMKQCNIFEIDIGTIIRPENISTNFNVANYVYRSFLTGFIGYRYQKPSGGLMFKAGYTPYFSNIYNDLGFPGKDKTIQEFNIERIWIKLPPFSDSDWLEIYNWIGLSVGYAF